MARCVYAQQLLTERVPAPFRLAPLMSRGLVLPAPWIGDACEYIAAGIVDRPELADVPRVSPADVSIPPQADKHQERATIIVPGRHQLSRHERTENDRHTLGCDQPGLVDDL